MPRRNQLPLWLTAEEAAELLRVHISTIYEYARQGLLPAQKIGKTVRIDRDGLFLMAREQCRKDAN